MRSPGSDLILKGFPRLPAKRKGLSKISWYLGIFFKWPQLIVLQLVNGHFDSQGGLRSDGGTLQRGAAAASVPRRTPGEQGGFGGARALPTAWSRERGGIFNGLARNGQNSGIQVERRVVKDH